ncbi:MAG: SLC13 family permease, partial [bacterium]
PIPLMPLMGIAEQKAVSSNYGHPLIFLFLGGFLIAGAMQRWGLHRRIALKIVQLVGTSPGGIVAGFMVATAFLSMWISNTATALMMFTVGVSLIEFVSSQGIDPIKVRRFGITLMLGIAYSASIGGVATLIGTPPNTMLASFVRESYGIQIDFAHWMMLGLPVAAVMLPLTWVILCKLIFPVSGLALPGVSQLVDRNLDDIGSMGVGEKIVAWVFALTALCWITRPWLSTLTGWDISDTSIALIAAILLFVIPASVEKGAFVVEWDVASNVPWGVLILFGGGLALAGAFKSTGLAEAIGYYVSTAGNLDLSMILLVTIAAIIFLTEITSNTATTATFLPVLGAVAVGLNASPLALAIPVAMASSMAFMMPVATPPNAIVFSYDGLHVKDMMKAGLWLNIVTICLVYLVMLTLAPVIFDF